MQTTVLQSLELYMHMHIKNGSFVSKIKKSLSIRQMVGKKKKQDTHFLQSQRYEALVADIERGMPTTLPDEMQNKCR